METFIKTGEPSVIEEGAKIIKAGGIVGIPTETVYGLGADATNEKAVASVFTAKGRPQDNPLICHISSIDELDKIAYDDTGIAKYLFSIFSPGPLTLVLKKKDLVPDSVTAGLDTVAVRIPNHKTALEFIKKCGVPIAAPSANTSGRPSPTTAQDVYEDLQGKLPLIIDGGECGVGIESTVLDVSGEIPVILRPGMITAEDLLQHVDNVQLFRGRVLSAAPAPGMKYRHYAPNCDMVLSDSKEQTLSLYNNALENGKKPIILARSKNVDGYAEKNYIDMGFTDEEIAKNLYSALRKAEKISDYIISETVDDNGAGYSVMNRMRKAAGVK